MERMLKNLYMVSKRAGVDIEEDLPQSEPCSSKSFT